MDGLFTILSTSNGVNQSEVQCPEGKKRRGDAGEWRQESIEVSKYSRP